MKNFYVLTITITMGLINLNVQAQSSDYEKIIYPKHGVHLGGTLQVIYSTLNRDHKGKFVHPFIIVEPYDAADVLKNDDIRYNMDYMLKYFNPLIDSIKRFYDIIYLDYTDGVDDIFRNARLLEEAGIVRNLCVCSEIRTKN